LNKANVDLFIKDGAVVEVSINYSEHICDKELINKVMLKLLEKPKNADISFIYCDESKVS